MKWINALYRWAFRIRYATATHRQFRAYVTHFYDHYNENEYSFNQHRITKCRFYDFPKSITIEIHSLSPGMIIGPKGETLDRFKAYMQKRYPKPIHIRLEETNPFK
jgi:ribosomal protein S3